MIIRGESMPNRARQTTWEGIEQAFKNTIYTADTFDIATEFECECTACYCQDCPMKDECGEPFTAEQWMAIRDSVLKDSELKDEVMKDAE